jgi:hydrogenase expression/formation protein HypD
MKYVDEFRDRAVAAAFAEQIKKTVRRPWTIMEVCGGQTHAIVRFRSRHLLAKTTR